MKLRYLKIIFIIILLINIIFYINEIHKVLDIKRKVKAEFFSKYNKEIDIGFVFNTRVGIGAFSFDKDGYYYGNAHIVDEPEIEFSFKYLNHTEKIVIEKYYYMAVWGEEYKNFLNDILRDKLNEISNVKINLSYNLEEYQMHMKEKKKIIGFKEYFSENKNACKGLKLHFDIKSSSKLTYDEIYMLCYDIFNDKYYGENIISILSVNMYNDKGYEHLYIENYEFYNLKENKEIEKYIKKLSIFYIFDCFE